ncbi:MAG: DUF262 domain-containing protein [Planctomycetaceae bacterium]|nr:DUF262 domain-containing protein [Planctomycetaceae bacterium]
MSSTTFKTNPVPLASLLRQCEEGKIQLPDFQRSWVWAEDRIQSLISSISNAFPIGALMTLESKPGETVFAHRPVQGAPPAASNTPPQELLLDGQQRMTSLFQTCLRQEVVETITPKNKMVKRWFYIDIQKALDSDADRDEAIFSVPEDRKVKTNFDKEVTLDLSKPEFEYENLMFPLNRVFDWDEWQECFGDYWISKDQADKRDVFRQFKKNVLENFKLYQVPVISLTHNTSHEAVCLVFEKVNTGGKPLDAFELLTAMYAAKGHKLRDDWLGTGKAPGIQRRLSEFGCVVGQKEGVLSKVASTDFLQAIALRHTKKVREDGIAQGLKEKELQAVRATRQFLLDLPLAAYLKYKDSVEEGFKRVVKFLRQQQVHRVIDLPYKTQIVPLAAIFSEIGDKADHAGNMAKIARWFWCGVFGELYGGAFESRFAKDVMEVPAWLDGGPEPTTVTEGVFRANRLNSMRTRLSAAYKGVHALLMKEGAKDFRSGQDYDATIFFDEDVDIHHIFPEKWCKEQKIDAKIYDTVINKTPLSYRTNRIIGGVSPSKYLARLQQGKTLPDGKIETPPISSDLLDSYLRTHCIDPGLLRNDDFEAFLQARRGSLLALISSVTGHQVNESADVAEDGEDLSEEIARDNELSTIDE